MLGLCCSTDFSLGAENERRSAAVAHGLLAQWPLLVWSSGSGGRRLGDRGAWAQQFDTQASLLHGRRDLPRPGIEPMSPVVAGGFLTAEPSRKPGIIFSNTCCFL